MLSKLDETLMRWVNDGYLWLLDRTGVYVASVSVAVNVLYVAWNVIGRGLKFDWTDIIFLSVMVLWALFKWRQQHMASNAAFNEDAMNWRDSKIRTWGALLLIAMSAPLFFVSWRHVVGMLFWMGSSYIFCILIRDREPKEFWAQAPKLATEKSR